MGSGQRTGISTKRGIHSLKVKRLEVNSFYGGLAQLARAWDSYPQGPLFDPGTRYKPWQGNYKIQPCDWVSIAVNLTVVRICPSYRM